MTRQQLFTVCFFGVLLLLVYQIGLIFRPFVMPVLWAVILAHLTYPLHLRMTRWLGRRKALSAGFLTATIMALGVLPIIMLGVMLVREAGAAYTAVELWIESGGVKRLPEDLARLPFGGSLQELIGWVVVSHVDLETMLLESAKALKGFAVAELTLIAENAFLLAANFLVMIFTLFFFFKDGATMVQGLYRIVPLEASHKDRIFSRLDQTLRAVVKGILVTAVVQGVLAGAAYWVLGAPFPIFLMALTMVLAPLPFGGTALVWVPVALFLYWAGPLWKALAMVAWGVGVVTMVDNILKPLLIGKGAELPLLFLFFSILGGLAVYGMIGLFLGPILLSLLITAIQIYREEYLSHEPEGKPGA